MKFALCCFSYGVLLADKLTLIHLSNATLITTSVVSFLDVTHDRTQLCEQLSLCILLPANRSLPSIVFRPVTASKSLSDFVWSMKDE